MFFSQLYSSADDMDDNISFRLANEQDIQAILEMSKGIYGGRDYLPYAIHGWFQANDRHMFVAELQGKVIGFQAAVITDGGHSILCHSLRIHKEYRGRGYSYYMKLQTIDSMLVINPGAASIRHLILQDNIPMKRLSEKMGYKAIMERNTLRFENVPTRCSDAFKGMYCKDSELYELGVQDAIEFALNRRKFDRLFPNNIMMVQRQAYEVMPENAEFIFKDGDRMFTDLSTEKLRQNSIPKSFSHGREVKRVDGHSWACGLYATDPHAFKSHLIRQVMVAIEELKQCRGKTDMEVFCATNLDFDAEVIFKEVVLSLEQDGNAIRTFSEECTVLYEKDLQ